MCEEDGNGELGVSVSVQCLLTYVVKVDERSTGR